MNGKRSLQQMFGLTLVVLLLAGCGAEPAEPTATPPLVPPTATPPPVPPTATLTLAVKPQPGATFTGPMQVRLSGGNGTASEGELELTITEDGTAIASASWTLLKAKCSNDSGSIVIESVGWTSSLVPAQPVPIANGTIEFNFSDLRINGQFTSPTEANATIEISTEVDVASGDSIICDCGTWNWIGKVE